MLNVNSEVLKMCDSSEDFRKAFDRYISKEAKKIDSVSEVSVEE